MGLNAAYTGEGELDVVMDDVHDNVGTIVAEANVLGDMQAAILGLWGAFLGALFEAQRSAVARDRIGDDLGPQNASMIMNIAAQVNQLHREFTEASTVTAAELQDAADPEANFLALGPLH